MLPALGFESPYPHQANIIRTKSSLWEMGSDYFFSLNDLRTRISEMELSSGLNLNREAPKEETEPTDTKNFFSTKVTRYDILNSKLWQLICSLYGSFEKNLMEMKR